MRVKGIDVSKHQGKIDWQKVKDAGIKFAFIRVGNRGLSSGKIYLDPYWEQNVQNALMMGIDVGVYFYSSSLTEEEAEEEAEFVLEHIKGYDITLPVCFDYEGFADKKNRNYGMTKEKITANCVAFRNIIIAHGYMHMLYGSRSYLPKKFDLKKLTDYLWVARYPSKKKVLDDEKYFPTIKGYNDRIAVWQCADCARIDGISGDVDLDYMYIDVRRKESEDKQEENIMNINQNIKAYSKKKDGNVKLAPNFKAKEFACKDGSDPIFIAPSLAEVLQKIRNHFGKPVTINSGYRTPTYNKKVGGAEYSQHLYGTAADIRISGVKPEVVAAYVETLMPDSGGIGIYKNFTHVDVRAKKSRWKG